MFRSCIYLLLAGLAWAPFAHAQATVECASQNHEYDECWAGPLSQPQLIHQESSAACIVNRTWGYNRKSGYIWVSNGCRGVFADVGGYHHGRGDTYDAGARRYDEHGHDTGKIAGELVLAAILAGAASNSHAGHAHSTSNYNGKGQYVGCHGLGCTVDNPDNGDAIDPRPQFDREGNPNFDTHGNYQGCHGVGCLVDTPDDAN